MRYFVNLDETPGKEPFVVDLVEQPSGALDVVVNGKRVAVDVVAVGNGSAPPLSVRVGGHIVDLTTEGLPPELGVVANGRPTFARVESERHRAASAAKKGGAATSDKVIKSPMPGRVIKMLVAKGAEVTAGQTLCVVEAMKMENEVKAKAAGTIGDVHVNEGATVEAGAKLISFA
ncbi:MAG: Pyruvate carboxyl transferase [Labilithrix sp.]|nr:Pyruvate carboxyl transferase [Labilithrix sp.]